MCSDKSKTIVMIILSTKELDYYKPNSTELDYYKLNLSGRVRSFIEINV